MLFFGLIAPVIGMDGPQASGACKRYLSESKGKMASVQTLAM